MEYIFNHFEIEVDLKEIKKAMEDVNSLNESVEASLRAFDVSLNLLQINYFIS